MATACPTGGGGGVCGPSRPERDVTSARPGLLPAAAVETAPAAGLNQKQMSNLLPCRSRDGTAKSRLCPATGSVGDEAGQPQKGNQTDPPRGATGNSHSQNVLLIYTDTLSHDYIACVCLQEAVSRAMCTLTFYILPIDIY